MPGQYWWQDPEPQPTTPPVNPLRKNWWADRDQQLLDIVADPSFTYFQTMQYRNGIPDSAVNLIWESRQHLDDLMHKYPNRIIKASFPNSYWNDPKRIARMHEVIDNAPMGWKAPDWLDVDGVENLYRYFEYLNPGKSYEEWNKLSAEDPGIDLANYIDQPPQELLHPSDMDPEYMVYRKVQDWVDEQKKAEEAYQAALYRSYQFEAQAIEGLYNQDAIARWNDLEPVQKFFLTRDSVTQMEGRPDWTRGVAASWQGIKTMLSVAGLVGMLSGGIGTLAAAGPGTVIGWGLGTLAGLYTGYKAYKGEENELANLLNVFNLPAEAVERILGMVAIARNDPDGLTQEGELAARWQASKSAYESQILPIGNWEVNVVSKLANMINPKWSSGMTADLSAGEVWMFEQGYVEPQVVAGGTFGGKALLEATARIQSGEDATLIYEDMVRKYGYSGTRADFISQNFLDPMQFLPYLINKAGASIAGRMGDQLLRQKFIEHRGNLAIDMLPMGWQQLATGIGRNWGWRSTSGIFDVFQDYGHALRTQSLAPDGSMILPENFSKFQIMVGQLALNKDGKLQPRNTIPDSELATPTNRIIRALEWAGRATPETKALQAQADLISVIQHVMQLDPNNPTKMFEMLQAVADADNTKFPEIAGGYLASPQLESIRGAVRNFIESGEFDHDMKIWAAMAAKRKDLQEVAVAATHDLASPITAAKVIDMLKAGETADLINLIKTNPRNDNVIVARYKYNVDPETEFRDPGRYMKPINFENRFKSFVDGRTPWHPGEFAARALNKMVDGTTDYLVKRYDLKTSNIVLRMSTLLKSAQSLYLLGLSPNFLVNNFIDGMVNTAYYGVFGMKPLSQLEKFFEEYELPVPARMGDSYGPADVTRSIFTQINPKDILTEAQGLIGKINKNLGIFTRLSNNIERVQGANAITLGAMQYLKNNWREGIGFGKMPAKLETQVRKAGVDPDVIYTLARSSKTPADFDKKFYGAYREGTLGQIITDAARRPPEPEGPPSSTEETLAKFENGVAEAADEFYTLDGQPLTSELLAKTGIEDLIIDNIRNGMDGDASILSALTMADEALQRQSWNDRLTRVEYDDGRITAEGFKAAIQVFGEQTAENWQKQASIRYRMANAYEEVKNLRAKGMRTEADIIYTEVFEDLQRQRKVQADENFLRISTILKRLNPEDPTHLRISEHLIEISKAWDEFYAKKEAAWTEFNDTAKTMGWDEELYAKMRLELDTKLIKLDSDTRKYVDGIQKLLDDNYVQILGDTPERQEQVRAWLTGVRKLEAQLNKMNTNAFTKMAGMTDKNNSLYYKYMREQFMPLAMKIQDAYAIGATLLAEEGVPNAHVTQAADDMMKAAGIDTKTKAETPKIESADTPKVVITEPFIKRDDTDARIERTIYIDQGLAVERDTQTRIKIGQLEEAYLEGVKKAFPDMTNSKGKQRLAMTWMRMRAETWAMDTGRSPLDYWRVYADIDNAKNTNDALSKWLKNSKPNKDGEFPAAATDFQEVDGFIKATIRATKSANFESFVHEMIHPMLYMVDDATLDVLAKHGGFEDANEYKTLRALRDTGNRQDRELMKKLYHGEEKIVNDAVKHMADENFRVGVPSLLKQAFRAISNVLVNLWKKLRRENQDLKFSDDVKKAMDTLVLGSEKARADYAAALKHLVDEQTNLSAGAPGSINIQLGDGQYYGTHYVLMPLSKIQLPLVSGKMLDETEQIQRRIKRFETEHPEWHGPNKQVTEETKLDADYRRSLSAYEDAQERLRKNQQEMAKIRFGQPPANLEDLQRKLPPDAFADDNRVPIVSRSGQLLWDHTGRVQELRKTALGSLEEPKQKIVYTLTDKGDWEGQEYKGDSEIQLFEDSTISYELTPKENNTMIWNPGDRSYLHEYRIWLQDNVSKYGLTLTDEQIQGEPLVLVLIPDVDVRKLDDPGDLNRMLGYISNEKAPKVYSKFADQLVKYLDTKPNLYARAYIAEITEAMVNLAYWDPTANGLKGGWVSIADPRASRYEIDMAIQAERQTPILRIRPGVLDVLEYALKVSSLSERTEQFAFGFIRKPIDAFWNEHRTESATDIDIMLLDQEIHKMVPAIGKGDQRKPSNVYPVFEEVIRGPFADMDENVQYIVGNQMRQYKASLTEYLKQLEARKTGASAAPGKYKWAREAANSFEVSSKGDRRYSAFYAKLKDGRSIEEHYQVDYKGYESIDAGKGKGPRGANHGDTKAQSYEHYKGLWKQYFDENPALLEEIRKIAETKTLTDQFATTEINQARAIAAILNETGTDAQPKAKFLQPLPDSFIYQIKDLKRLYTKKQVTLQDITKALNDIITGKYDPDSGLHQVLLRAALRENMDQPAVYHWLGIYNDVIHAKRITKLIKDTTDWATGIRDVIALEHGDTSIVSSRATSDRWGQYIHVVEALERTLQAKQSLISQSDLNLFLAQLKNVKNTIKVYGELRNANDLNLRRKKNILDKKKDIERSFEQVTEDIGIINKSDRPELEVPDRVTEPDVDVPPTEADIQTEQQMARYAQKVSITDNDLEWTRWFLNRDYGLSLEMLDRLNATQLIDLLGRSDKVDLLVEQGKGTPEELIAAEYQKALEGEPEAIEPTQPPAEPAESGYATQMGEPDDVEPIEIFDYSPTPRIESEIKPLPEQATAAPIEYGKPGNRHNYKGNPLAENWRTKGGWKLHLTATEDNYTKIDQWLDQNWEGQYKLLDGGEPQETDFTIYIGARDDAMQFAQKIESEIGGLLLDNNAGRTDILFTGKVSGRFDIAHKIDNDGYEFYGIKGMPYNTLLADTQYMLSQANKVGNTSQVNAYVNYYIPLLITKAHAALAKKYGTYYTGTGEFSYKPPFKPDEDAFTPSKPAQPAPRQPAPQQPAPAPRQPMNNPTGATPAPMLTGYAGAEVFDMDLYPLLSAIRDKMRSDMRSYRIDALNNLDADTRKQFQDWLNTTRINLAETRRGAVDWGIMQRDNALLNYSNRANLDAYLELVLPYQFWFTRNLGNWAKRMISKPAMVGQMVRRQQMMQKNGAFWGNLPKRLQGKMVVPFAFSEDWMGNFMFFNPWQNLYPPFNLLSSINTFNMQASSVNPMYTLQDMVNEGEISQEEMDEAVEKQSGALWDKAYNRAIEENNADLKNPVTLASMMMSHSLWITQMFGDKPAENWPSTKLGTAVRSFGQRVPGILGPVSDMLGKALEAPEKIVSRNNFAYYGEWGDYKINRMIANMVAEGTLDYDRGMLAMINKSGSDYELAKQRLESELSMKVAGSALADTIIAKEWTQIPLAMLVTLFPGGLYPIGEEEGMQLKQQMLAAWDELGKGNPYPINQFFNEHEEHLVRTGINDGPELQMKKFLAHNIREKYDALDPVNKGLIKVQLGEGFVNTLLSGAIDYDKLNKQDLAIWLDALNGNVPETEIIPETQRIAPNIFTDDEVKQITQYMSLREELYPNHAWLQQNYGQLVNELDRKKYLAKFPELKRYWDWNRKYKYDHPVIGEWSSYYGNANVGDSYQDPFYGLDKNVIQGYLDEKKQRFPDREWQQEVYFSLPTDDERYAFIRANPSLAQAWEWDQAIEATNPTIAMYKQLREAQYNMAQNEPGVEKTPAQLSKNLALLPIHPFAIQELVISHSAGTPLSAGTRAELLRLFQSMGEPGGNFEDWIDSLF